MANRLFIAGAALALATTAASAADLPAAAPPPPPPVAAYSWTGVEFGLTTSFAFDSFRSVSNTPNDPIAAAAFAAGVVPGTLPFYKSGFDDVGGGVGFNYQFTPGSGLVIGGMVDVSYFNLSKNAVFDIAATEDTFHQRLGYLGTVNGRIGYAFDRFLIYGTGGFAFGGMHEATNITQAGLLIHTGTLNQTETGYDFGGGVEYAIPNDSVLNYLSVEKLLGLDKTLGLNLFDGTIRGEFIHYDLGRQNVVINPINGAAGVFTSTYRSEGNVIRLGLGYKYGGESAAIVARY